MNTVSPLLGLLALCASVAPAEDVVHPIELDRAQVDGRVFEDFAPAHAAERTEGGDVRTEDVERYLSADGRFDFGMYRASGTHRYTIEEAYGVDEFMYFIDGSVKLTSADGHVQLIEAGEAVMIPKDWTGTWDSDGYTKIYVIYSPDAPIE